MHYHNLHITIIIHTVKLKGNLTHTDRAHTTYWPKAHGYINPYWHVWDEKSANTSKRQEHGLREHYSGPSSEYILFLH